MNPLSTTTPTAVHGRTTTGRHLLLVVVTLLAALFAAGPAHGLSVIQPEDAPTDDPGGVDDDLPTLAPALLATPDCAPAGFHYKMIHADAPEDAVHQAQWREAPAGPITDLPAGQPTGFVASGEGEFQVRGAIVSQGQLFHAYDWVDVAVVCHGIELEPNGRTNVTIETDPICDPHAGIGYEVQVVGAPNGQTVHQVQWREVGGAIETVDGATGTLVSGEGTFELRGLLLYPGKGFYPSDWVQVTVDCREDPGGDPEDDPRPGTPTFTG